MIFKYFCHNFIQQILQTLLYLSLLFAYFRSQSLRITEKAVCVSDILCGIHEILLLRNKINKMTQNDSGKP